jgi:hypothetical protein
MKKMTNEQMVVGAILRNRPVQMVSGDRDRDREKRGRENGARWTGFTG